MKKNIFCVLMFSSLISVSVFAEDTVDLQWSVCESGPDVVLSKIGQDSKKPKKSQMVTYFDTAKAQLTRDGVSFRTKDGKKKDESSVKVRFNKHKEIDGVYCEWDRYGSSEHYTCEVKNKTGKHSDSLWSQDQMNFLTSYYHGVNTDRLIAFGPYKDPKWKLKFEDQKVSFDSVETKQAGSLMEFSIKVPFSQKDAVYADFTEWLNEKGIVLCRRQESKTARLLRAVGMM